MRVAILGVIGALLLSGCVTEEMVDKGRLPEPRAPHEPRDGDYAQNRRDACKGRINTDDYLDCLGRYDRGETTGGSVTVPFPKRERPLT